MNYVEGFSQLYAVTPRVVCFVVEVLCFVQSATVAERDALEWMVQTVYLFTTGPGVKYMQTGSCL